VLVTWAVTRYGLLATVALTLFQGILTKLPLPLAPGAPYLGSSLIILALLVALVAYAFRTALGARPVFRMALDD